MTKEYYEAISHKAVIELAVISDIQNDVYKRIIKEISERTCESCIWNNQERPICEMLVGRSSNNIKTFCCNKWEGIDANKESADEKQ